MLLQVALLYMLSRLVVNVTGTYWPFYITRTLDLDKVRRYVLQVHRQHMFMGIGHLSYFPMEHFPVRTNLPMVFLTITLYCLHWQFYI